MTFNRMGTVPLPLALHLASYTVLGLFCFFAGALNLIGPGKFPHGIMFFLVCGFSWGYVFGILMARKEVVLLGFLASAAWSAAAAAGAARFAFDWRLTALLVGLGAYGLVTLAIYRNRILEHWRRDSADGRGRHLLRSGRQLHYEPGPAERGVLEPQLA